MISKAEAQLAASSLLQRWNLDDVQLEWNGSLKWALALADVANNKIIFSLTSLKSGKLFFSILKHEMAHFLDWREHGGWPIKNGKNDLHGKSFKRQCLKIGASPSRFIKIN
jgi:hypothetical protein